MNFLATPLFTPQQLGDWIKVNQSGADIPTETGAPTLNIPGLSNLVPTGKVGTVVDVVLDDVLSTAATNSGPAAGTGAPTTGRLAHLRVRHPVAIAANERGAAVGDRQPLST